jgi:hypothetical protein
MTGASIHFDFVDEHEEGRIGSRDRKKNKKGEAGGLAREMGFPLRVCGLSARLTRETEPR